MSIHPPLKEIIVPRISPLAFLLALCALTAIPAQAVVPLPTPVQRAFVSGNGDNANALLTPPCAVKTPCKTFAGALPAVAVNGEIVALDSAPYGSVTLTQSISITVPTGIYGGISVFAGSGITIAAPNINVVLRGLTINGQGGSFGINVDTPSNSATVSIENCVISNLLTGVLVNATGARVRIVGTVIRNNSVGAFLTGGAIVDIFGSKILENSSNGVIASTSANTLTQTNVTVSDTLVSGNSNSTGISASSIFIGSFNISVIRSTIAGNGTGIESVSANGGFTSVTVSESLVAENGTGLFQGGANSTLISLGNNTVARNSNPTTGNITPLLPQ